MLRRRNVAEDSSNGPILDEQEQEELIEDLRRSNHRINDTYVRLVQVIVSMAILLQLIFLLNVRSHTTPLSIIFTPSPSQTLIPFPSFWSFLCILRHLHDIILLDPKPFLTIPLLLRSRRVWPITLIAPCISIILNKDFAQTAWWCLPTLISILPPAVQYWIAGSQEDLDKLGRLRYKAKGA